MTFSERFLNKIIEHSADVGGKLPKVLKNCETLENVITILGENSVQSIAAYVGIDLGNATRESVLGKRQYTSDPEELNELIRAFQEDRAKHNVNVLYASTDKEGQLIVQVYGCVFEIAGLEWKFCSYSTNFLRAYFGAKKITPRCNLKKGSEYCEFLLEGVKGLEGAEYNIDMTSNPDSVILFDKES